MTRHWTVSIDGGAPVHLDLAQYVAAKRKALEHSAEPGIIEALLAKIED